jgi:thymidine phosphorylase
MSASGFFPQEIIRRKRDGGELTTSELEFIAKGLGDGSIGEAQAAAFAMVVFFRGMTLDERVAFTRAMATSGEVFDWHAAGFAGPILDKHSTGGVGDKVSLMLAPIIAACGGIVPMISGRGLGHTGGTLDKLASIPGYDTAPGNKRFRQAARSAGCAIIGQTDNLAPADRRLYAIRDVTASVESIPLITTSILSKKLATGLDALVLDVKFGSGAFMSELSGALELANSLVTVANRAGLRTAALLTDMNQVLGTCAGNAIEVREAVAYLRGEARDKRLDAVTRALAAEMLVLGALARDDSTAQAQVERALASGAAAERFQRMVAALGGPADFIERPDVHLARAPVEIVATPTLPGYVAEMDVRRIGLAVMGLGGGRRKPEDKIDHAVGLSEMCGLGEHVGPERPLARIHARSRDDAEAATAAIRAAIRIADAAPAPAPIIGQKIGPGD